MKKGLKVISFDVDGTLVDLEYNDLIWFKEIPELVAKKKKINFEKSLKYVYEEYTKLGEHNLNWYDINYWITYFRLKVSPKKILEKYFKFSFSALSDFKELKNSEIYSKISKTLNVCPEQILHIGDHWEFDYLAAQKAGMNAIYLDRSNAKKGKFIIHNLGEVKKIIDDNIG